MQRSLLVLIALSALSLAGCAGEATVHEARTPSPPSPSRGPDTTTASPDRSAEAIPLGKKYAQGERWALTDAVARKELEGTKFGEQEILEFWTRKGWHLTQREEQYFANTEQLYREGKLTIVSRWYQVPYSPVYQTIEPVTLLGVTIPPQTEFWMEPCENADKIFMGNPRFARADGYSEEHEGHVNEESGPRHEHGHEHEHGSAHATKDND
jgi:hypothetical protein